MTRTTFTKAQQKAQTEAAGEIVQMLEDWEQGKQPSPDESDYVIVTHRALTKHDPTYIGSVPEGREFIANVLYEGKSEELFTDTGDETKSRAQWANAVAEFITDQLTAE